MPHTTQDRTKSCAGMRTAPTVTLVFYRTLYSQSAASLTMGTIAATLRAQGITTHLCLLRHGDPDNERTIAATDPDIIIAKPNFKDIHEMLPIIRSWKSTRDGRRVYLCGPLAALQPLALMETHKWIDGIFLDGNEEAALAAVQAWNGTYDTQLPNTMQRNNDGYIHAPTRTPPALQFHDLPAPVRDIEAKERGNLINIEMTRGCPFRCAFCHIPKYQPRNAKEQAYIREPKDVVDEMEKLKELHGKTLFVFNDPMFWAGPQDDERIATFCRALREREMDVHWYIYLRCNPFPSEQLLREMSNAGLVRVFLGVESADNDSLIRLNKMITKQIADRALEICRRHHINVHIGFMVFDPLSTIASVRENIRYLHTIHKLFRVGVIIERSRLIPGTSLHEQAKAAGCAMTTDNETTLVEYQFRDRKVHELFFALRAVLAEELERPAYNLEYHCVAGELLRCIASHAKPGIASDIEAMFTPMQALRIRANDRIKDYADSMILMTEQGATATEMRRCEETARFKEDIVDIGAALKTTFDAFVENVKAVCGEGIVEELYRGEEGI